LSYGKYCRYKIVKGLWSALHYLHHQCSPYILHRDIKPSNILLDDEFNAKLGDFGLSRVAQDSGATSVQTEIAVGTAGYMDPLCMTNGQVKLRPSSDVYSFGIVLLEIAHGKNEPDLVRKVHTDRPGTFMEDAADKRLAGQFDKTEMGRVIVLGLWCSERDENRRPSLIAAMQFLENGGELHPAATTHEDVPHTATTNLA
jgi:serine/threonine protein kinase